MYKVSDHVKGLSKFTFYRSGYLYYKTEDTELEFPISVDDTDGSTFLAEAKSIVFMRWIRKHLNTMNEEKNGRD